MPPLRGSGSLNSGSTGLRPWLTLFRRYAAMPNLRIPALMYTFHMSWWIRPLVLSVAIVWAFGPQLVCFMPEAMLTEPETECCKQMANDFGKANMTHECCRTVVSSDEAVAVKTHLVRYAAPQLEVIATLAITGSASLDGARRLFIQNTHAPPQDPGASSLTLRI